MRISSWAFGTFKGQSRTHIDVVKVFSKSQYSDDFIGTINATCTRAHQDPRERGYLLSVFQPLHETLALLEGSKTSYVELAEEIACPEKKQAADLVRCLGTHLRKKYSRGSGTWLTKESATPTFYSGPRRARDVIVIYASNASKTGFSGPVVRFERRLRRKAVLQWLPAYAFLSRHLADENLHSIIWENCSIEIPHWEKLARLTAERGPKGRLLESASSCMEMREVARRWEIDMRRLFVDLGRPRVRPVDGRDMGATEKGPVAERAP